MRFKSRGYTGQFFLQIFSLSRKSLKAEVRFPESLTDHAAIAKKVVDFVLQHGRATPQVILKEIDLSYGKMWKIIQEDLSMSEGCPEAKKRNKEGKHSESSPKKTKVQKSVNFSICSRPFVELSRPQGRGRSTVWDTLNSCKVWGEIWHPKAFHPTHAQSGSVRYLVYVSLMGCRTSFKDMQLGEAICPDSSLNHATTVTQMGFFLD
ncbi:hypothetical protein TNCV_3756041 [Trichonephila clavipes]|nr:hypothetical protein TNCV_3756041 [Trichonephila clavipes]